MSAIDNTRLRLVQHGDPGNGPVVCWISRDQRLAENWALLHAAALARQAGTPLVAAFCLAENFLDAGLRQFSFLLAGLRELEAACLDAGIGFALLRGDPGARVAEFVREVNAAALVHDFDPLRIKRRWQRDAAGVSCPVWEADAHNIVPCLAASVKQEFSAATFRRRITPLLQHYLTPFPNLEPPKQRWSEQPGPVDWERIAAAHPADSAVPPVDWIAPGERAALIGLREFIGQRLEHYPEQRNDPNAGMTSRISPWLHFGHLAPQRAALEVRDSGAPPAAVEAYLEELIVRRELSDNFCFYNPDGYDSIAGIHHWARKTLDEHRGDPREYLYAFGDLEQARTHDPLWNAAQKEMVLRGTMPGYLRMYWAKKILEWSPSPEEAITTAIRLNDRWQLDGRDPNGYVGVLWSIGGVHDRAWSERPVFGKIRYMNYNGCRRKFDVDAYIARVERMERQ